MYAAVAEVSALASKSADNSFGLPIVPLNENVMA